MTTKAQQRLINEQKRAEFEKELKRTNLEALEEERRRREKYDNVKS